MTADHSLTTKVEKGPFCRTTTRKNVRVRHGSVRISAAKVTETTRFREGKGTSTRTVELTFDKLRITDNKPTNFAWQSPGVGMQVVTRHIEEE